jgi:hypothetical protein
MDTRAYVCAFRQLWAYVVFVEKAATFAVRGPNVVGFSCPTQALEAFCLSSWRAFIRKGPLYRCLAKRNKEKRRKGMWELEGKRNLARPTAWIVRSYGRRAS